jgi:hypothetical protein
MPNVDIFWREIKDNKGKDERKERRQSHRSHANSVCKRLLQRSQQGRDDPENSNPVADLFDPPAIVLCDGADDQIDGVEGDRRRPLGHAKQLRLLSHGVETD